MAAAPVMSTNDNDSSSTSAPACHVHNNDGSAAATSTTMTTAAAVAATTQPLQLQPSNHCPSRRRRWLQQHQPHSQCNRSQPAMSMTTGPHCVSSKGIPTHQYPLHCLKFDLEGFCAYPPLLLSCFEQLPLAQNLTWRGFVPTYHPSCCFGDPSLVNYIKLNSM